MRVDGGEAQRLDILAQQRARLRAVIDEQRERRAARDRLEPERAGAGEQVEHARAGDRIAVGMHQDVEQRLAQPVGGRADACDFGAASARPRNRPPTMRIQRPRRLIPPPLAGEGGRAADRVGASSRAIESVAAAFAAQRTAGHLLLRRARCRAFARRASAPRRSRPRLRRAGRASGLRLRLRLALHDRRGEIRARRLRELLAELVAQHARRHFGDLAFGKLAQLERPERHADQPRRPAARDGAARCAPRGSCPRGSRT